MNDDNGMKIFAALLETYRILGAQRTIDILNDAVKNSIESEINQFDNFIVKTICKFFRVTEQELKSNQSRGSRTYALAFYAYFLKLHFNYSLSIIAKKIERDPSQASRYISFVENLNTEIKVERELTDKLCAINIVLSEQKEKIFKTK